MARGKVVTTVARVSPRVGDDDATPPTPAHGLQEMMTSPALDHAAERLATEPIDAIGFASTSAAYAIGHDDEVATLSRLERRVGMPVVATCASAVLALRVLDVERIALVHPPWFSAELNELGTAYFRSRGLKVTSSACARLSLDPQRIETKDVIEWTTRHVDDDAEAVFIGGNGFRAAGAIEPLERALGRHVLESNQVLLWNVLARARATVPIDGYGQLFSAGSEAAARGCASSPEALKRLFSRTASTSRPR
jgi:maleate isomerase